MNGKCLIWPISKSVGPRLARSTLIKVGAKTWNRMSCPARPDGKFIGWCKRGRNKCLSVNNARALINRVETGILPVRQRRAPGFRALGDLACPREIKHRRPASVLPPAKSSPAVASGLLHDLTGAIAGNTDADLLLIILLWVLAVSAHGFSRRYAVWRHRSLRPDRLWACRARDLDC